MRKLIYISHKYGGRKVNADRIARLVTELSKASPDYTFISPVHCFGFMYDAVDYDMGMRYCLDLLGRCDEMWVFGERTAKAL